MVGRAEEVGSVLPKLRVSEGKKLVVSIANLNAIEQSSVDTGEEFIIPLLVSARVDTAL